MSPFVGLLVQYFAPALKDALAAIVTRVHDEGKVDLRVIRPAEGPGATVSKHAIKVPRLDDEGEAITDTDHRWTPAAPVDEIPGIEVVSNAPADDDAEKERIHIDEPPPIVVDGESHTADDTDTAEDETP